MAARDARRLPHRRSAATCGHHARPCPPLDTPAPATLPLPPDAPSLADQLAESGDALSDPAARRRIRTLWGQIEAAQEQGSSTNTTTTTPPHLAQQLLEELVRITALTAGGGALFPVLLSLDTATATTPTSEEQQPQPHAETPSPGHRLRPAAAASSSSISSTPLQGTAAPSVSLRDAIPHLSGDCLKRVAVLLSLLLLPRSGSSSGVLSGMAEVLRGRPDLCGPSSPPPAELLGIALKRLRLLQTHGVEGGEEGLPVAAAAAAAAPASTSIPTRCTDPQEGSLGNFTGGEEGAARQLARVAIPSAFPSRGGKASLLFQPADYLAPPGGGGDSRPRRCAEHIPDLPAEFFQSSGCYGATCHVTSRMPENPPAAAGRRPAGGEAGGGGGVRRGGRGPVCHIGEGCIRFGVLLATLQRGGVRLAPVLEGADLVWAKRVKPAEYKSVGAVRGARVNHIPGTWALGRKDSLARTAQQMAKRLTSAGFASAFAAQGGGVRRGSAAGGSAPPLSAAVVSEHFAFHPATFVLPGDAARLRKAFEACPGATYIVKPSAAACGQGIFLLDAAKLRELEGGGHGRARGGASGSFLAPIRPVMSSSSLSSVSSGSQEQSPPKKKSFLETNCIAQSYISNPFLINGFKVDFRCYVVVASVHPLRIYFYDEGMVRFATDKFPGPGSELGNRFAHLTNYSINKHSEKYQNGVADAAEAGSEGDEEGASDGDAEEGGASKWTLSQFRHHCARRGIPYGRIVRQFHDIAVKSILAVEPSLQSGLRSSLGSGQGGACFQIFGVDFLLDSALRAHLLEFNIMPSVNTNTGSPLDALIKCNFVADLLTLVGVRSGVPTGETPNVGVGQAAQSSGGSAPPDGAPKVPSRLAAMMSARRGSGGGSTDIPDAADAQSFWSALSPADRAVVADSEDENLRRGHFTRVFPSLHTSRYYACFMEARRANALLIAWERAKLGSWEALIGSTIPIPEVPPVRSGCVASTGEGSGQPPVPVVVERRGPRKGVGVSAAEAPAAAVLPSPAAPAFSGAPLRRGQVLKTGKPVRRRAGSCSAGSRVR